MTPKSILGISRSTQFSPHSEDRDAAIFAAVSSRLSRFADVSIISEDLFIAVDLSEFDLVFSMARGRDVLECLAQAEREEGLVVINSAEHLLNLSRANLALLFKQNALSVPNLMVITVRKSKVMCSLWRMSCNLHKLWPTLRTVAFNKWL